MTKQLTTQETLFIERMALYLIDSGAGLDDAAISAAAEAVTAADRKLVRILACQRQREAAPYFADRVWNAMQVFNAA